MRTIKILVLSSPPLFSLLPPSSAQGNCNDTSNGRDASCWAALHVTQFFRNWASLAVVQNPPQNAAKVCHVAETWSQCFLRISYGESAPVRDCYKVHSRTCAPPTPGGLPTSPQAWYGAFAIYAIWAYFENWTNAINNASHSRGFLLEAYDYADSEVRPGQRNIPDYLGLTFFELLFFNGLTLQDRAIMQLIKTALYNGEPEDNSTRGPPKTDKDIAKALTGRLRYILEDIFEGTTPADQNSSFLQVVNSGAFVYDVVDEASILEQMEENNR
ncbi:MAG: hypothetical protein Q9167_005933 [Letrouitia subvulpina]